METKLSKKKIAELDEIQPAKSAENLCSGASVSQGFCAVCVHGVPYTINMPPGTVDWRTYGSTYCQFQTTYLCDLRAGCKDFKRK